MNKLLVIFLFYLLSFSGNLLAQEEFVDPPSTELTKFKFKQLTGGVVLIKAVLGDFSDSLSFIMDTGSGGISLDSSTVAQLGLKPSSPERIIRGIGGTRKVGFIKDYTLKLNDLIVDSLDFHVVDYELLSAVYGERIDGVIGYSVFSRYIVKINYDTKEISFWSNGPIKYPGKGYLIRPSFRTLPLHVSSVKDATQARFNYLFDIGAGLTVLFSQDFVDDSAFIKSKRKRYLKQGEGLGGKVNLYMTVIKELGIGPYRFRNVPVNIFDDEYNVTSYPSLGGLIGNDIFRRFNCILNYNKRQIHLTPNTHFRDPFDYTYTGIELYLINGRVVLGEVPKGSPAEQAGLQKDDELLGVNRRIGLSMDELKHELQSATGNIKVIVKRGEELMIITLKAINIMKGKKQNSSRKTQEFPSQRNYDPSMLPDFRQKL